MEGEEGARPGHRARWAPVSLRPPCRAVWISRDNSRSVRAAQGRESAGLGLGLRDPRVSLWLRPPRPRPPECNLVARGGSSLAPPLCRPGIRPRIAAHARGDVMALWNTTPHTRGTSGRGPPRRRRAGQAIPSPVAPGRKGRSQPSRGPCLMPRWLAAAVPPCPVNGEGSWSNPASNAVPAAPSRPAPLARASACRRGGRGSCVLCALETASVERTRCYRLLRRGSGEQARPDEICDEGKNSRRCSRCKNAKSG